ncbi:hypothetical protein L2E82_12141 [Cichorium intybus]|uniref:Uncharacterized protein n=1 Tax=Cichorium intybus TaxID=13427 RepID=A0ACB9GF40_CICIN|nr:hypothetical protein L2E82_12141 [Cichorium intybus]
MTFLRHPTLKLVSERERREACNRHPPSHLHSSNQIHLCTYLQNLPNSRERITERNTLSVLPYPIISRTSPLSLFPSSITYQSSHWPIFFTSASTSTSTSKFFAILHLIHAPEFSPHVSHLLISHLLSLPIPEGSISRVNYPENSYFYRLFYFCSFHFEPILRILDSIRTLGKLLIMIVVLFA